MEIVWQVKAFEELTVQELYGLLRLREQVFIIEQNCIYPDLDNKDQKALHVLGKLNGEIIAYSRLFKPGDYFDTASIGRVVNDPLLRGKKVGYALMQESIKNIKDKFGETIITISAQAYLLQFYQSLGFEVQGEGYLEDGIPRNRMIRKEK